METVRCCFAVGMCARLHLPAALIAHVYLFSGRPMHASSETMSVTVAKVERAGSQATAYTCAGSGCIRCQGAVPPVAEGSPPIAAAAPCCPCTQWCSVYAFYTSTLHALAGGRMRAGREVPEGRQERVAGGSAGKENA